MVYKAKRISISATNFLKSLYTHYQSLLLVSNKHPVIFNIQTLFWSIMKVVDKL